MSDNRDILSFQGTGLDTDSDLLALGGGNSRYRLNVGIAEDGNHQVLTNLKGNTLKAHTLSTGASRVMGSVEDKENNAIIYFVNNANDDHSIVRYNRSTDDFTNILSDEMGAYDDVSVLAIPSTQFIDAGIIGNEGEQFLVWTDGAYPKMINIQYAIDGNYSTDLTEEEISFYKVPLFSDSINNITAQYITTGSGNNPKILNKYFQFAIRLKYYDKTYSTLSDFSEIAVPIENIPSGKNASDTPFDHIAVSFGVDNNPDIVDSWELLFRIIDIGDGAPGVWNIYDSVSYTSTGAKSINFKNDKSIGVVTDEEAFRLYDFVPNKSNHVGIIDSNIAVFDVKEEGFDNVDISATVVVAEEAITDEGILAGAGTSAGSGVGNILTGNAYTITVPLDPANDYNFHLSVGSNVYSLYTYGLTEQQVYQSFTDYFNSFPIANLTLSVTGSYELTITNDTGGTVAYSYAVLEKCTNYRTLKTGASYKFGVQYGYSGKRGSVQTSDSLTFTVDDIADVTSTQTDYRHTLEVTLTNGAPTGATDFRFVSFGSDVDYFEEYAIRYNTGDITDDGTNNTIFLEEPYTVIKRDEMVNRMRLAYGDETSGIDYGMEIEKGDTIKFLGYFATSTANASTDRYDIDLQGDFNYIVESVTDTEIRVSSSAIRRMETIGVGSDILWGIQIIRNRDTFYSEAQGFSLSYPISEHGDPINITDYFADVWKSKQVFVNELNYASYGIGLPNIYAFSWMEKPKISLYNDSWPSVQGSQGKIYIVNEFAAQRGDRKIRWGGKFLDEAGVNFLTKFESQNEAFVDDRNGPITKIQQIGDTLKVYQERKVTSFYLKKKSSTDSEGNTTFLYSDDIIDPNGGSQSAFDNGCTHFESYVKNLKNGYFIDVINGNVVRDSLAGLEPISEYGMHTFFKAQSERILELGSDNVRLLGTYDDDSEIYVISCIYPTDLEDSVNFSVGFHEPSNRWMSLYSLPTTALDYYARLSGKTYISFLNGQLYVHNDNTTRNNFWGEQYTSQIQVHSNTNPGLMKIWDSVQINSTGQWAPSTDGDVEVSLPTVQQSRLKQGKFDLQEGEYRTEFMRDMLSGYSTPQENNLFNGDALRGYVLSMLLRNGDTDEANLRLVKVNGTTST